MIANAKRKIRYAVVGLGYISQNAALPAFAHAKANSEVTALVSDDPLKLSKLGRKYRIKDTFTYDEFDQCLNSGIDAVYIGLPNTLHADFAIRAAKAGIHVLTEKPMAGSIQQGQAMVAAAESAGVKLMVGYRLHFEKANLTALELVRSGRIGEVRFFSSSFSMQIASPNIRLRQDLGGGSLGDLGIYCINAARTLFGAEPVSAYGVSTHHGARFSEVDEMTSAVLTFPGERIATFTSSFGAATTSAYEIVGTKGSIRVDPAYEERGALTLSLTVNERTTTRNFPDRDQFAPEFLCFSRCILEHREVEPSGQEGLADLRVIDAVRRSAALGKAVTLGEGRRPHAQVTPAQEIRRAPSKHAVDLVHAQEPSKT